MVRTYGNCLQNLHIFHCLMSNNRQAWLKEKSKIKMKSFSPVEDIMD